MSDIFIATLGMRPEAITIALDLLREAKPIEHVLIVHTDPDHSAISGALNKLKGIFKSDPQYRGLKVEYREIYATNGAALIDIIDKDTASDYFRGIYGTLLEFKQQDHRLHVLIAGGRKAMSVYAALAATLIFHQDDQLWHVVSPSNMIEVAGQFHIPAELKGQVYLVDMPLIPARIGLWELPAELLGDPLALVEKAHNTRKNFLDKLTEKEEELVLTLEQHPDWTDEELARKLKKATKTVNNQFSGIYDKMIEYIAFGGTSDLGRRKGKFDKTQTNKLRQVLLRLLQGKL